jgi:mono/diheme cytochrome c family protein
MSRATMNKRLVLAQVLVHRCKSGRDKTMRKEMLAFLALSTAALVCGIGPLQAQDTKSTATGVFTEEQANKGEAAYQSVCASCHGTDLHSTEAEAPDLTEGPFKFGWQGKTIAERFEIIRKTMPPQKGGSFDDQTYLDIVTYILRFNNVPSGNQALQPDMNVLKQIVISVP